MPKKTFLVTCEYGSLHSTGDFVAFVRQFADVVSLDEPDSWPHEVWQAFERAQAARTEAFIANRASYQDQGHQLKHPATRYQAALAELGVEVALAEVEEQVVPRRALGLSYDDGKRTPPHGDPLH